MLRRLIKLKRAVVEALDEMSELRSFRDLDWNELEELVKFLAPYHEATTRFSGAHYPTINQLKPLVPKILRHGRAHEGSSAADALTRKLDEYSGFLHEDVVSISNYLGSPFKFQLLATEEERAFARSVMLTAPNGAT